MLGRDVLVLQALRFVEGALRTSFEAWLRYCSETPGNLRQALDLFLDLGGQRGGRHAQLLKQRRDHAVALRDQRPEQVQRLDLLLAGARAHFLGGLQRFLGLYG